MTRKEWIEKNLPAYINDRADGGVIGCPRTYRELVRIDPSVLTSCKGDGITCTECWNMELNIKEERSKNMTRKEWMLKNHPDVVCDTFRGGVLGCPSSHRDLANVDPSATECNRVTCSRYSNCTECWNAPIPQQPNDEVPMPVVGGQFWTFVRVNFSPNTDLLVVGNFVIIALMKSEWLQEIGL